MKSAFQKESRISRRNFLKSLSAATVLGTSTLPLIAAGLKGRQAYKVSQVSGVSYYASEQKCISWCWAACAETIVKSFNINVNDAYGRDVAQPYFSAKVFGSPVCQAATPAQMAYALTDRYRLNGSGEPIALQAGQITQLPLPRQVNQLAVNLIKNNIPFATEILSIGQNTGHFLIIDAIEYLEDNYGNVIDIRSMHAVDPFPYTWYAQLGIEPPPTTIDASIYARYNFVGIVWATRI